MLKQRSLGDPIDHFLFPSVIKMVTAMRLIKESMASKPENKGSLFGKEDLTEQFVPFKR